MSIVDDYIMAQIAQNKNYKPALADLGILIYNSDGTLKSTKQILKELLEIWTDPDNLFT